MVNDWLYKADLSRETSIEDGSVDDMAADRVDDLWMAKLNELYDQRRSSA